MSGNPDPLVRARDILQANRYRYNMLFTVPRDRSIGPLYMPIDLVDQQT